MSLTGPTFNNDANYEDIYGPDFENTNVSGSLNFPIPTPMENDHMERRFRESLRRFEIFKKAAKEMAKIQELEEKLSRVLLVTPSTEQIDLTRAIAESFAYRLSQQPAEPIPLLHHYEETVMQDTKKQSHHLSEKAEHRKGNRSCPYK